MAEGWGMSGWGGTLTSQADGGGGAVPVVQNLSPPEGAEIHPATALEFDLMFSSPLVALVIWIAYGATGLEEVAFDGANFSVNYAPNGSFLGSEQQAITGGYHFILRRRSGWPFSPSIVIRGSDSFGNPVVV